MKLAKLDENIIGKRIATVIKEQDGRKLVNEGTLISERILERLKVYKLNAIYIEDENVDIELHETIDNDKRIMIIKALKDMYKDISNRKYNVIALNKLIKEEILPEIKNEPVNIIVDGIMGADDIAEHSLNVCLLSVVTAMKLGFGKDKIEILAKAALLHDIGKIIKSDKKDIGHEQIAFEYLKNNVESVLVYTTVRYHHETIDGKGPQKQSIESQNDFVKIISLTNFYENLLRKGHLLHHECFEQLQSLINIKFEKTVYDAFAKSIYLYPVGLPIKLNNNEFGIVVRQNNSYPLRPIIRTKTNEYNLLEHLSLFIEKAEL